VPFRYSISLTTDVGHKRSIACHFKSSSSTRTKDEDEESYHRPPLVTSRRTDAAQKIYNTLRARDEGRSRTYKNNIHLLSFPEERRNVSPQFDCGLEDAWESQAMPLSLEQTLDVIERIMSCRFVICSSTPTPLLGREKNPVACDR